jgi:hypothetical protein
MEPDERFLDYMPRAIDLGSNTPVTLIATDKALYILKDWSNRRSGGRLPWGYVTAVGSQGNLLALRLGTDERWFRSTAPGGGWTGLPKVIERSMRAADRNGQPREPATW